MRRIVATRSGGVLSTIKLSVSSPWQRAQRATRREALMRSNSLAGYWRRVALHAFDGALDFRRLHGDRGAKTARAVTLDAVLRQNLAHPQRPERGDIALAGQIRRQARDPLLHLAYLSDQSDGEDQVGEHSPETRRRENAGFGMLVVPVVISRYSFGAVAMRRPVEQKGAELCAAAATLHGSAGCAPASRRQIGPPR